MGDDPSSGESETCIFLGGFHLAVLVTAEVELSLLVVLPEEVEALLLSLTIIAAAAAVVVVGTTSGDNNNDDKNLDTS